MNSSNKKYKIIILFLLVIIVLEIFIPIKLGPTVIINRSTYNQMNTLSNKYLKQDEIIKEVKKTFLYEVDDTKIREYSLKGALAGFDDPYTVYLSKEEWEEFKNDLNGIHMGVIGILLKVDKSTTSLVVRHVFDNSPAKKSGLKKGDRITQINDVPIDSSEYSEDIASKIRGKENTSVKLTILRQTDILNVDINRENFKVPSTISEKIDDIGYIRLIDFGVTVDSSFEKSLNELYNKGIKKLIIDVRGNPGGILDKAINITNYFVPKGTLVAYTKDKQQTRFDYRTKLDINIVKMPIAILADSTTASAAEIFLGAAQDHKFATVIGETTFGKGVVQKVMPLADGSAIKVTVSEYYTPKNRRLNKKGITPDIDLSDEINKNLSDNYFNTNLLDDVCIKKAIEIFNNY